MKRYLALLDYAHLDNGVFLKSFARALAEHQKKDIHSVILHGDSEYTERVIQTGVMRNEAKVRSIKDLNHRLIALFADEGASTIGINPYRRNFITYDEDKLHMDQTFFGELPHQPALLLSTLVFHQKENKPVPVPLPEMTRFLYQRLDIDELIIFSKSDEAEILINDTQPTNISWNEMEDNFRTKQIPDDLTGLNLTVRLTTARDFHQIPDLNRTISLK